MGHIEYHHREDVHDVDRKRTCPSQLFRIGACAHVRESETGKYDHDRQDLTAHERHAGALLISVQFNDGRDTCTDGQRAEEDRKDLDD